MPATLNAKAVRLLAEGRVQPTGSAAAFEVDGDHGCYHVAIGDGWALCSCPAFGSCSHIASARLLHDAMVDGVAETVRRHAPRAVAA